MKAQLTPMIMVSVFQSGMDTESNNLAHLKTTRFLNANNIGYKECLGVYAGTPEKSIMLTDTQTNRALAFSLADMYNQECILIMDNEGTGFLYESRDKFNKIGQLKVTEKEPETDYTHVLWSDTYFQFI